MKTLPWLLLLTLGLAALALAHDDDDDDEKKGRQAQRARPTAPLPGEAAYRAECGSCHLAYPPGLLPAASWKALMGGLEQHFGQNAELDEASRATLTAWLEQFAAESGSHPLSRRVLRSVGAGAPLRVMEVPLLRREHDELRPAVYQRPSIASRAHCAACHPGAETWAFDEHRVKIPR